MSESRLIGVIALPTWLLVAVPVLLYHVPAGTMDWRWTAQYLAFGALFALDLRRPHLLLLGLASAAALSLVLLRCNGYEGALLALIAMQLGTRLTPLQGIAWILGQTLLLGAGDWVTFSPRATWLLLPPYLALQLVAFFVFLAMAREVAARTALAGSNAELRGVAQILADSSRIAERLRIAGELHDSLGHHLTALSLNLEAALQLTGGAAHASVATAQELARRLLGEVRAIVAESRAGSGVNLAEALGTLVRAVPRPRIHLDIPPDLHTPDPERAHTLLRCAQEMVTNAARHSDAENLWLAVRCEGEALRIEARDDGRGSDSLDGGFGIRGMRERIAHSGGELRVVTQPGHGFEITALLPVRGTTA
ncbi:MAG TPA: sensor histidine kinase [Steroidobacteraceae bacterium]|nr:sensor histidine kinase [Steroidobacteraceae bacterium]